jgi:acetolactate synthase-1/2/3 large subunit
VCTSIAASLTCARRPLLVVGNGARRAARELRILAERLAVPVATTPHAKGVFPESHPLHLGGIGLGGHPSACEYLAARPDVVVIVGSRLGELTTNGWTQLVEGTDATFQIDREPLTIGRNQAVTFGVVADAALALRAILDALPDDPQPLPELRPLRRVFEESLDEDSVPLHPAQAVLLLQQAFPEATFTADMGEHCAFALHYLVIDDPDRFRAMVGLGSMGSGIGCAIGMHSADRCRPVVCICGDGGLAMHIGELLTCVENRLDVVFAVFNDGRWNMVHHGMRAQFGRLPAALPSRVADFAHVAQALGATGVRVERARDLEPDRLRSVARRGGPVVLDIRIDADVSLGAAARASALRRSATRGAP